MAYLSAMPIKQPAQKPYTFHIDAIFLHPLGQVPPLKVLSPPAQDPASIFAAQCRARGIFRLPTAYRTVPFQEQNGPMNPAETRNTPRAPSLSHAAHQHTFSPSRILTYSL
ncbi:hypothetical protein AcV5_005772 [Taiwanofungus camphoratus]|nr:hypothetical protein AcV5_005772 [Antrodia cinnamomea]